MDKLTIQEYLQKYNLIIVQLKEKSRVLITEIKNLVKDFEIEKTKMRRSLLIKVALWGFFGVSFYLTFYYQPILAIFYGSGLLLYTISALRDYSLYELVKYFVKQQRPEGKQEKENENNQILNEIEHILQSGSYRIAKNYEKTDLKIHGIQKIINSYQQKVKEQKSRMEMPKLSTFVLEESKKIQREVARKINVAEIQITALEKLKDKFEGLFNDLQLVEYNRKMVEEINGFESTVKILQNTQSIESLGEEYKDISAEIISTEQSLSSVYALDSEEVTDEMIDEVRRIVDQLG